MKTSFSLGLLLTLALAKVDANSVALVVGGQGGGVSAEIVTDSSICLGSDSTPEIPNAPDGNLIGWFAQYDQGTVYLCGGQTTDIVYFCHTLKIGDGAWNARACEMQKARRYAASTMLLDGRVVVLGGYNNKDGWLDEVEIKTPGQCEFTAIPEWTMPRKLYDACAVTLNDTHLMLIGGSMYGQQQLDNVDILDMTTNTWTAAASLPRARSAPGCLRTTYNGVEGVMVTGGLNSLELEHYKDTLFFPLDTQEWIELADMTETRMGHTMFHVGSSDEITIVGGYNDQLLGGVEHFAEGSGWSRRGGLTFPRHQYGGVEIPSTELTC